MSNGSNQSGCTCGCGGLLALIAFIFFLWAFFFGLQVGDSKWKVGLWPPRIEEVKDFAP